MKGKTVDQCYLREIGIQVLILIIFTVHLNTCLTDEPIPLLLIQGLLGFLGGV